MTELHLLRHAHAGNPEAWSEPDEARPLSAKGEAQADRLGRFLAGVGFKPDAIITSPKLRAARTAEIVADQLGLLFSFDTRLADGFDLADLERLLSEAGDPVRPVIVGHDPDFSEVLGQLVGSSRVPMRKGAFARVDVDRPLEPGGGVLRWLVPPDLLKPDR
ncbi:MAG: histidine phosphatase family protein [Chloroflexota bacterium]